METVNVSRVVPNITSDRPEETAEFFTSLLGFDLVMDSHSVLTLCAAVNRSAQINILRAEGPVTVPGDGSVLGPPQLSLEVEDVDAVHAEATARDLEIVYPITDEDWGVRRFFVKDPNGLVINILSHV